MRVRLLQDLHQMLLQGIDRARDEPGARAKREQRRRHRLLDRTARRRGRAGAGARGRRVLALGQAINLVVEEKDLHIDVATQDVKQMVAADRQSVAVAGGDPDVEFGVGELHAGSHRRRAPVDGVEPVGRQIVGEARRAADAGDEDRLRRIGADIGEHLLRRLQDGVIAAAGAPADLLIGGEVLWRARRLDGGNDVHRLLSRRLTTAFSISSIMNGWPDTLLRPSAATRYCARSRWTS